jgi:hypothetical protein
MTPENLAALFAGGYIGVDTCIGKRSPAASNLAQRCSDVLPSRPNKSWETRWRLYVYCAPDIWHVVLALSIAAHLVGFNAVIRVDPGLKADAWSIHDTLLSLRTLAKLLEEITNEWRIEHNFSRSALSTHFDQAWLQDRIDLLEADNSVASGVSLRRYMEFAVHDQRVAAIVVLGMASDIARMLSSEANMLSATVRDERLYRLEPSGRNNSWVLLPLGKL